MRDEIFLPGPYSEQKFRFDEAVARVFDDMAARSIPFYAELQASLPEICRMFFEEGSSIYDLGCSTGNSLIAIGKALGDRDFRLKAIDASAEMLAICREKLAEQSFAARVELVRADIREIEPRECSIALLNYTLQFIPPEDRKQVLAALHRGLRPGGALVFSEKVEPSQAAISERLYEDFKRRNGYSREEIANKKRALNGVLRPLSLDANLDLLAAAGFEKREVLFKAHQFATILAVKS